MKTTMHIFLFYALMTQMQMDFWLLMAFMNELD